MKGPPPRYTLIPYTPHFRSTETVGREADENWLLLVIVVLTRTGDVLVGISGRPGRIEES